MQTPRVFISMGTPRADAAKQFRNELEALLRDRCGVNPRIIGKNEYPPGNPLTHIRDVMRGCHGVVVVAYERLFLEAGMVRRGELDQEAISDRTYTTPWNHIESAMAYNLDLPIYILCQRNLTEEGLIESKIDWWVQPIDILPGALAQQDVVDSIKSWIDGKVIPLARKPRWIESSLGNLKISEMSPGELKVLIGGYTAAFALGVGAALLFPKLVALIFH